MTPVFVYGTLKEGFPNFHINKGIRVDGIFHTKNRYPFYLVGERHTPWLVLNENEGHQISGQMYMVDDETMENMDILEGIGQPNGYQKVQITIVSLENISKESISEISPSKKSVSNKSITPQIEKEMLATVYVKSIDQLNNAHVQLGPLKEYEIEHSLLYKPLNSLVG